MKSGTAMKINTNMLTNGTALHVTSNDGEMLQSNGTLVYIDGNIESNFIASASMVEVKGQIDQWNLVETYTCGSIVGLPPQQ